MVASGGDWGVLWGVAQGEWMQCGGPQSDLGTEDAPLEWGRVLFVGSGPQQRGRVLCGAGASGGQTKAYGRETRVGAKPLCGLGGVRLD
jgi:hypothetical protein